MVTFFLTLAMNTAAMLDSTRSALATRPSTKILAMSLVDRSTTMNTMAKIAFRGKESLVRVWMTLSEGF